MSVDKPNDFLSLVLQKAPRDVQDPAKSAARKDVSGTKKNEDATEGLDAWDPTDTSDASSLKKTTTLSILDEERLQTVAFECLVSGLHDTRVTALLHTLGWPDRFDCFCIAGSPKASFATAKSSIERKIRDLGGLHHLVGQHQGLCVALIVVEGAATPEVTCTSVLKTLHTNEPVCLGPVRAGTYGACQSISATLYAMQSAPALRPLPRPLHSDDVLPERALLGDESARKELYETVYMSLLRGGNTNFDGNTDEGEHFPASASAKRHIGDTAHPTTGFPAHASLPETAPAPYDDTMLETVSTFLEFGGSLDATARELNVHPNTVRYRLKKTLESTGWDANDPREAFVLRVGIALGRMHDAS